MILIPMILIVGILEYGMDCFLYLIGLEVGLGMPYKANYYTTGYNVWWWITTFFSSVSFIIGGANYKYMR